MPGGAQGLDRYAYANNSPLNYTDPSGHTACTDDGYCGGEDNDDYWAGVSQEIQSDYGITFEGDWDYKHTLAVLIGVLLVGQRIASATETGGEAFREVFGYIKFTWETKEKDCAGILTSSGGCTYGSHNISFWSMSGQGDMDFDRMTKNVVHELGHAFYRATGSKAMGGSFSRDALRPNPSGELDWQQQPGVGGRELFADTFIAWVYDAWNTDTDELIVSAVDKAKTAMNGW